MNILKTLPLAFLVSASAFADTGTINVTGTVLQSCTVAGDGIKTIDVGDIEYRAGTATAFSGSFTIPFQCSSGLSIKLELCADALTGNADGMCTEAEGGATINDNLFTITQPVIAANGAAQTFTVNYAIPLTAFPEGSYAGVHTLQIPYVISVW